jgi:MoaA/NifB/PqqE/SkfB family radical SAM enzyme
MRVILWGLSIEETMTKKYNSWEGWKCSAGAENVFIDADGYIYVAACKVKGKQGNIYDGSWSLSEEWTTCPAKWCMCGQDMQLRKVRNESFFSLLEAPPKENVHEMDRVDWVVPYHYKSFASHPRFVTWDLGRRCNYSCSYCHPMISNNTEALRTDEELRIGVEAIEKNFIKNNKAKFIFTGGEPTIIPAFMDMVRSLRAKGHDLHTQTNCSRNPDYHRELIRHSFVGVSVHLEFAKDDRLLKNFEAIIDEKEKDHKTSMNWFGIRIMVGPGNLERALELKKRTLAIPHFAKHGACRSGSTLRKQRHRCHPPRSHVELRP